MSYVYRDGRHFGVLLCLLSAFVVPAGAAPSPAPGAQDEGMSFAMNAQATGRGQTPMSITVTRWSSPDERDAFEEVFRDQGMQALADALRKAPEVGFIRAPSVSSTGWRLRYAMILPGRDNTRILRLATDRPISFVEANRRRQRTWDFNVTLIELVVDEEGRGDGALLAGVEFSYDESNETFGIKQISTQPVRLTNVRPQ